MRRAMTTTMMAGLSIVLGCAAPGPPLDTVSSVELDRYLGKWYEIAKYPNSFQAGCVGAIAEYSLRDDGRISVVNTCYEGDLDGPVDRIEGSARIVDEDTNAKLRVSFFGPFEGDYWIIGLDEDYEWALVGEPRRNFLWILSRTPQMDDETFDSILAMLPDLNYDPSQLELTPQPASPEDE